MYGSRVLVGRMIVQHSCAIVLFASDKKKSRGSPKDTRMAQRWPLASRPARDARTPCAPARGAPAVSTPEAPCPTRISPHARSPCCLAHCAPRRQARDPGVEQEMARKATEKHESMVHSIEAAPIAAKNAHARVRRPRPAPNRTETVPCAVPSRTAPHRTVPCPLPPNTLSLTPARRLEPVILRV